MDATTILSQQLYTPVNYCLAHLQLISYCRIKCYQYTTYPFSSIGPGSSFTISVEAGTDWNE